MMEIERQWGQTPGWFASQSRGAQIRLLAWLKVRRDPTGEHFEAAPKTRSEFWGGA